MNNTKSEAEGDLLADFVVGMFRIPEQDIVGQMERTFTIGDTGEIAESSDSDDYDFNPLADIFE